MWFHGPKVAAISIAFDPKKNKSVESLGYKGMFSGAEKNYPHLCYHGWLSHLILILQSETYYKPFWGWLPKITIIHGSDIILPILLGGELPRNRQRIVTLVLTGPAPYLTLLGWTNPLTSSMSQYIPLNPIKSQLDFGDQTLKHYHFTISYILHA